MGIRKKAPVANSATVISNNPASGTTTTDKIASGTIATDKITAKPLETVALSAVGIGAGIVVSRSFTIPGTGQFESMKVGVSVGRETYEEASDELDRYMVSEAAKAGAQFKELLGSAEEMEDDIGAEDDPEEDEDGDEDEDAVDAENVTAEDIDGMDRAAMVAFIEANDVEIDATDTEYKGKSGLTALRDALKELLEDEDETDGDEADEGEDAGDDADADEDDITEADIRAMSRSELVKFIKTNEIDVDPDAKAMKKLDKLADAVIEAMNDDDEADEDDDEADGDEGEADDDDADEDDATEGYSRDELEKLAVADLKEIWDAWKIKGKFPTGSVAVKKKIAIAKILEVQEKGV